MSWHLLVDKYRGHHTLLINNAMKESAVDERSRMNVVAMLSAVAGPAANGSVQFLKEKQRSVEETYRNVVASLLGIPILRVRSIYSYRRYTTSCKSVSRCPSEENHAGKSGQKERVWNASYLYS